MVSGAEEELGIGSVLKADVFGYHEWEVVEIRRGRGPLSNVKEADGRLLMFEGTLMRP